MDADEWFTGWPDAHMEKPDDEIRTMAGTSGLDFIRGLRLRDIYLRLRRVPYPWRPIETAPRDGSRVLLAGCGENGGWVCVASWRGGRWRDGDYSIEPPTHWMPDRKSTRLNSSHVKISYA